MAADILDEAELLDGYRSRCRANRLNAGARAGQSYELETLSPAAYKSLGRCIQRVPLVSTAQFAILSADADGGMPHTRPRDVICLPKGLVPLEPTASFCTTLAHEGIHIHQRQHPAMWRAFLARRGWVPVPAEEIPAEFRERVRINPDTLPAQFWAWRGAHVPMPMLKEGGKLEDTNLQWYDLRTGALLQTPPSSFSATVSTASAEHPYEFYAYEWSERLNVRTQDALEQLLRT